MVYNSLYYTVVIACNILNYLCFGQVLLIENESDVSQNNRAENSKSDDFYVAYEREDSRESRYNNPDDTDAALIDLLNNLGLRSQTPLNLYFHKNNNYGKKDQRHIKGNKINLHRGDVILHNNIYSTKPKTNLDVQVGSGKKRSKKGKPKKSKTKKPSKKGETINDKLSGLQINPGVDDIVKIAADLYEKILKLNEHGETKIDGINIHNRGNHQNTNQDDKEHEPHDQKPHDQDDENDNPFESIEKWLKEIQAIDETKHKKGGKGKNKNTQDHGPHEHQPHDQKPHDQDDENDNPFESIEKWLKEIQAIDETKHKKGGKGKNKNTQDHGPHEHQPHDQKPHDQDDENDNPFESIEKWLKEIQAIDETKHKKGEGKNKNTQVNDDDNLMPKIDLGKGKDEIDLLFHEITVATSTILDLVHKVGSNNNGCTEIERSVKYIAALAENKCIVS